MRCKYKFQDKEKFKGKPYCTLFNELCEDISFVCDKNCQVFEDNKLLEKYKQALHCATETINCQRCDTCLKTLDKIKEVLNG